MPCPAICRDEIKEGMVHAQGGDFQSAPVDPLTLRMLTTFFDVLRVLLTAGVSVVAEAAFQDQRWREGLEPLSELARLRIVHCTVDAVVARERVVRRLADNELTRMAHADAAHLEALESGNRSFASFESISIPVPSIVVDTTEGYLPDLVEII